METYQVSFYRNYPDSDESQENSRTAFVLAKSFEEAKRKVEQRHKNEYGSATVFAVATPENVEIIL